MSEIHKKHTILEDVMEGIGQALFECDIKDNNTNLVLDALTQAYIPVLWPESQELMEQDWFDECLLDVDCKFSEASSSTYLVPINRYLQLVTNKK